MAFPQYMPPSVKPGKSMAHVRFVAPQYQQLHHRLIFCAPCWRGFGDSHENLAARGTDGRVSVTENSGDVNLSWTVTKYGIARNHPNLNPGRDAWNHDSYPDNDPYTLVTLAFPTYGNTTIGDQGSLLYFSNGGDRNANGTYMMQVFNSGWQSAVVRHDLRSDTSGPGYSSSFDAEDLWTMHAGASTTSRGAGGARMGLTCNGETSHVQWFEDYPEGNERNDRLAPAAGMIGINTVKLFGCDDSEPEHEHMRGQIVAAYAWARVLSGQELRQLARDPFCLLRHTNNFHVTRNRTVRLKRGKLVKSIVGKG